MTAVDGMTAVDVGTESVGGALPTPLVKMLQTGKLIVCVGSGGVGKTTTSAVLGLAAAQMGRRAVVITIDPARRLARSLGLTAIGSTETPIPSEVFAAHGEAATGSCAALMLDVRSTFDALVEKMSPDNLTRQRILENNVYRHMATSVAGSQEYMATEKLYELYSSGRYDLVVLDTPPMKNALDFLEAQNRILRLLDESIIKWFLAPFRFDAQGRVVGQKRFHSSSVVFRLLGYILGEKFVQDVSEFFAAFSLLLDGFRVRHDEVSRILRRADTHFLVVTSPRAQVVHEALHFEADLRARELPFTGFVVNQVEQRASGDGGEAATEAEAEEHLAKALQGLHERYPELSRLVERAELIAHESASEEARERELIAALKARTNERHVFREVPRMARDVHDVGALLALKPYLLGG